MSFDLEHFAESFGERLMDAGKLDRAALSRAQVLGQEHDQPIHQILTKLGLLSDTDLAEELAAHLSLRRVQASDFPITALYEGQISARFLKAHQIMPIGEDETAIELAMVDPLDEFSLDAVRLITKKSIKRCVATPAEVENAIARLYGDGDNGKGAQVNDMVVEEDVERLKDLASEAPVIRAVNLLVVRAVEMRASDIHIEPFDQKLRVRYRVDGILREMEPLPQSLRAAIVSRIKIMAKLDIAERRLPQDGRINIVIRGAMIDLRISTMPTIKGESVVVRVLDRSGIDLNFAALGFSGTGLDNFQRDLDQPNGIILVAGPTGSGKTTTLYTSLLKLNDTARNLLSVEDPVEYEIAGINQIQVKAEIGLDFANVLRSILRHDPDVIMIGEIRDRETANIAVRAALTGHLVLSTLHTNDAASSITRLMDMDIENFLLTASLRGVLAQRLVRRLCLSCRQGYVPSEEVAASLELDKYFAQRPEQLYQAKGCSACNNTGFHGRICIFEYLHMSPEIQRLILRQAEIGEIAEAAVAEGMRSAYFDGLEKAVSGQTTVEEVLRVTHKGY